MYKLIFLPIQDTTIKFPYIIFISINYRKDIILKNKNVSVINILKIYTKAGLVCFFLTENLYKSIYLKYTVIYSRRPEDVTEFRIFNIIK